MPRQLWLLRHGDAEAHGSGPDALRALTAKGRRQSIAAGGALARLEVTFDAAFTSPRVRCLETARLAVAELGITPAVHQALQGGFDSVAAQGLLAATPGDGRILLVGHEPDFSHLVHDFTGARIELKKGAIAAVNLRDAELLALLRPREIELIARGA